MGTASGREDGAGTDGGRGSLWQELTLAPPQRHSGSSGKKGKVMQRSQAPECVETVSLLVGGGALKRQDTVSVCGGWSSRAAGQVVLSACGGTWHRGVQEVQH